MHLPRPRRWDRRAIPLEPHRTRRVQFRRVRQQPQPHRGSRLRGAQHEIRLQCRLNLQLGHQALSQRWSHRAIRRGFHHTNRAQCRRLRRARRRLTRAPSHPRSHPAFRPACHLQGRLPCRRINRRECPPSCHRTRPRLSPRMHRAGSQAQCRRVRPPKCQHTSRPHSLQRSYRRTFQPFFRRPFMTGKLFLRATPAGSRLRTL